jgi:hypothetical protein
VIVDGQFHVAILGLLERPVVVPVSERSRDLSVLLGELRQPASLIETSRTFLGNGSAVPGNTALIPGAVIILDASRVDRAALANSTRIPAAVPYSEADIAADAPAPLQADAAPLHDESADVAAVAELPSIPNSEPADVDATIDEPAAPLAETVPASLITDIAPPLSERIETPVFTPDVDVISTDEAKSAVVDIVPPESKIASSQTGTVAALDAPPSIELADRVVSYVLLLAGIIGISTLYVWLRREAQLRRNARFAEQMAMLPFIEPPAAIEVDNFFADLVGNQIEIIEEPLVLPDQLDLHGKAVGQQRLIIHPAQPLAGPHFTSTPAPVRETVTAAVGSATPSSAMTEPPPRPTRPTTSADSGFECEAGLLERVLMRMQNEGRR